MFASEKGYKSPETNFFNGFLPSIKPPQIGQMQYFAFLCSDIFILRFIPLRISAQPTFQLIQRATVFISILTFQHRCHKNLPITLNLKGSPLKPLSPNSQSNDLSPSFSAIKNAARSSSQTTLTI